MKIYISASIINSPLNKKIATNLENFGHQVFLPQSFCPEEIPHESYPESIYKMCITAMKESDIGLILLDCYGRDSSWECGWYQSQKKPLIGYVSASLKFLQDWMIKGSLDGLITTEQIIKESLLSDDFLMTRTISLINEIEKLGSELSQNYDNYLQHAQNQF